MRIVYDILFSLTVNHSYYADRIFESFELIPDKKTAKLIHDHRLICRTKDNCWNVFFQTEGPFATTRESMANDEFLFHFLIRDSSFFSITDDAFLNQRDEMLFFNSTINWEIIPEKRDIIPLRFDYEIHHLIRPVNIVVTNFKGTEIHNNTIVDPAIRKWAIDFSVAGVSMYNISENTVPPGDLNYKKVYATDFNDPEPMYGTIYFKILPVEVDAAANHFLINFETIS